MLSSFKIDVQFHLFYSVVKMEVEMKTAVIRARVPETLKKEFEVLVAAHEMNLSKAIRVLMTQYVERENELARRRKETLDALEDVETGQVVKGDKVMDWLASWGTDDELEPPA